MKHFILFRDAGKCIGSCKLIQGQSIVGSQYSIVNRDGSLSSQGTVTQNGDAAVFAPPFYLALEQRCEFEVSDPDSHG